MVACGCAPIRTITCGCDPIRISTNGMGVSLGVRGQHEGLVHISQLRKEGRVKDVSDVVRRGQRVKVKVLGITGSKMSLSMKVSTQMMKLV